MRRVNLVVVFGSNGKKVLMCKRRKDPYKGLINFVGGKCLADEDGYEAAYRELYEETGISEAEIDLIHFMDMDYYLDELTIEIYCGKLKVEKEPYGTENELIWLDREQDYFNTEVFAGKGNLGHIMAMIETNGIMQEVNYEGNKNNRYRKH